MRDHRVTTDGFVECTTDDVADRIRTAARSEPPEEARLLECLRLFARRGACGSASATAPSASPRSRSFRASR